MRIVDICLATAAGVLYVIWILNMLECIRTECRNDTHGTKSAMTMFGISVIIAALIYSHVKDFTESRNTRGRSISSLRSVGSQSL